MTESPPFSVVILRQGGAWLLDDRRHGLSMEPLVFGMEKLLDRFAELIPGGNRGFRLLLSDERFAGFQNLIEREEADAGGFWYRSPTLSLRGWLGERGLRCYFKEAPAQIFVRGEPLDAQSSTQPHRI